MSPRPIAFVALALTLAACGGDGGEAESAAGSSSVTDAIRTPSGAPADSSADLASTDTAGNDAADDDAGSPKEEGGAAPGTPGGRNVPSPPPPSGGKPAGGTAAPAGRLGTQRHSGTLEDGDETLDSGEYADEYSVEVRAGQTVTVEMTSDDFDAYLILRPPSAEQVDNDDGDDGSNARITHRATESGTYRVLPTSYEPGETGAYRVTISVR